MAVQPQAGPQEQFLASPADIAIYGGSAGSGKSMALLLEGIRHAQVPDFTGALFRRTTVDLRQPGGLWHESQDLYRRMGGVPRESPTLTWRFPSGAMLQFAHLEHDKTVYSWQGAQLAYIGFDELTHYSSHMFWYLISRLRSKCGVRPYMRAGTNPDADSWVADLIEWWIDPETGYPIEERAGVIRWFVRVNDQLMWADSPDELADYTDAEGQPLPPKSLTFIPGKLSDNPALTEADPDYQANLLALGTVERERLLYGNWKIRPAAGLYFRRGWVEVVDAAPAGLRIVRGWDLAATEPRPGTDPDWTTSTKIGVSQGGRYYVLDHVYDRLAPHGVQQLLRNTATQDGHLVQQEIPQDPAQAGKMQAADLSRVLDGFNVRFRPVTGDKITRFSPFSAQCEAGNVAVVRGPWNERWFRELENFPPGSHGHDDDADSTSTAYHGLNTRRAVAGVGSYGMR